MSWPRIAPLGDGAITVALGDAVEPALNARVHRLAAAVRAAALPGVVDVVPAYAAVTVFYEPLHHGHAELAAALAPLAEAAVRDAPAAAPTSDATSGSLHRIPVRYDGPDLAEVARRTGLTPEEVVRRHAERTYAVYLLGFVPGFAYLGDLDASLVLPRRADPRPRVPVGAVAIAGRQTAVYPLPTPGGWHLIGRTDAPLFDAARTPPALLAPGDRVRFVPA
ncbi:MAG TPA: 5-oxoprolinase subunit PxpB [Gemmatimonadaceae bacterium]|nr:5-oxoprolinase subunit PxpB [Gemmatimonadaceae bacterium]